ncbi:uncharacterized protein C8A04DRAFT_14173 [Dichotomopilus funicola]|uniref:Uncharacterized protein n=1 Tax=Dichotomopilus funicola TaxID=1934379 RepID=A0AAN6V0K2_9PEZI|nr:hypothetical protein C8A04DRAFT_14173 [Dichotomopilus funicola]
MAGGTRSSIGPSVKFVGHDATGLPVKRKQVHQACLPCRKRKVSSVPTNDDDDGDRSSPSQPAAATDRDTSDAAAQLLRFFHHGADKSTSDNAKNPPVPRPRPMSPEPPFLGDLNPEGILAEATMAPSQKPSQAAEDAEHQVLGYLPPTSPRQSKGTYKPTETGTTTSASGSAGQTSGPFFSLPQGDGTRFTIHVQDTAGLVAIAQTIANRTLADKVMPSAAAWEAMRDLYLRKIHPIFPIYDKSELVNLPKDTALRELIQGSVCLAAATDPDVGQLLTFKSHANGATTDAIVSFDEYSREMACFINKRLVELQESRQISLINQIQVMGLTCFYWQPANPIERFEPLNLYAKLASIVHTHGVHVGVLARSAADTGAGHGSRVFKCLYALDRLIGAISARPLLFHNFDLVQIPRPDAQDPPIFRLFMSLIQLLDEVIEMYRPRPKVSFVDLPVFERMAIEAGAQCEPESLLVTLEVLYHAIGVLSVRMPRHRFRTAPECDTRLVPPTQHLPPSSMNARRSHSADRILDVINDYKLSPMPFVPYASTLSLSVAYRKWRFSRLPMFRTRGGADFKKVLPVVQRLGAIWSSARINGQLGQAVMLKLDSSEADRQRKKGDAGKRGRDQSVSQTRAKRACRPRDVGSSARPAGSSNLAPARNAPQAADHTKPWPQTTPETHLPSPTTTTTTSSTDRIQPTSMPQQQHIQPLPPTWTAAWTSEAPTAHQALPTSYQTFAQATEDEAIPLPGTCDPSMGTTACDDTGLLAVDDLLIDDDALFSAWDPQFAQSVDFSFCSILDPGNPFAWPEYCGYSG